MATAHTAQIEQAIRVWRLRHGHGGASRWQPPESFLPEHAAAARLTQRLPGEPDFVNEHADFFAGKPVAPPRLPPLARRDLQRLAAIGTPEGPSVQITVALLRQARQTPLELEAAEAVLHAPGPVPEPVRLEAGYLFAVHGELSLALEVLTGERSPPPLPSPLARPKSSFARPAGPKWHGRETAEEIVEDAEVWGSYLALPFVHATRPQQPATPPEPLPDLAVADPPLDKVAVSDLEVWKLAWIGRTVGPSMDQVIATLKATRGTKRGRRALDNVLAAHERVPLPQEVLSLCAELLAELGDRDRALALLAVPPPAAAEPAPPGIDVDTPLRESDAAARAAEAEAVLAHDTQRLGVGERRTRFQAVARAGELTLEAIRSLGGRKHDALRDAGRALEDAGEPGRAAEVYALGGDHADAGRLGVPARALPSRDLEAPATLGAIAAVAALDRRGLRLAALEAARALLAERTDLEVAAFARGVLARLLRGPIVTLAIDGRPQRVAFGETITVGRVGATFALGSPLVSRLHLRLQRRAGVAVVEDLGSHNGTWLAGARVTAPLPVGTRLDLMIGREIPCSLQEEPGGIAIDLAGEHTLAPLGPLVVGGLRLVLAGRGDETVVTLTPDPGAAASLAGVPIDTIELALGDVVRVAGEVPLELRVIA